MSKYRRDEPAPITKHKHCPVCGTPIDMSKDICSDKCRVVQRKAGRARTRNLLLITGAALLIFLLLIFLQK